MFNLDNSSVSADERNTFITEMGALQSNSMDKLEGMPLFDVSNIKFGDKAKIVVEY